MYPTFDSWASTSTRSWRMATFCLTSDALMVLRCLVKSRSFLGRRVTSASAGGGCVPDVMKNIARKWPCGRQFDHQNHQHRSQMSWCESSRAGEILGTQILPMRIKSWTGQRAESWGPESSSQHGFSFRQLHSHAGMKRHVDALGRGSRTTDVSGRAPHLGLDARGGRLD